MKEISRKAQLLCWLLYLVALPASWAWLPQRVGDSGKEIETGAYVLTMLLTALPMPWLMGGGMLKWLRRHPGLLNLPHKSYWLAPERAGLAWARLDEQMLRLGWWIWCLLVLVHYRAVAQPAGGLPAMPGSGFEIAVFVLATGVLASVLHSTLAWRVPKAEVEAFRDQETARLAADTGSRAVRRPPRPARPGRPPQGPTHGEPR